MYRLRLRARRWSHLLNGDTGAALGLIIGIIIGSILLNGTQAGMPRPASRPTTSAVHDAAAAQFETWAAQAGS
jgi:hypothetical protein